MKGVAIFAAIAGLWMVSTHALAAEACEGEEIDTPALTATCENGVMVYRGYAPEWVALANFAVYRPDDAADAARQTEDRPTARRFIHGHGFLVPPVRLAPPPQARQSGLIRMQTPRPHMITLGN